MKGDLDKSLLFLTLSFVCIWLVVDVAVGKNYLSSFLGSILPFMGTGSTTNTTLNEDGDLTVVQNGETNTYTYTEGGEETSASTVYNRGEIRTTDGKLTNTNTTASYGAKSGTSTNTSTSTGKTYTTTDGKVISERVYNAKKDHATNKMFNLAKSVMGKE